MKDNKLKNKILYYAIIPAFLLCLCFLSGCNTANNNTFKTISANMNTVIDTINDIKPLTTNELIISDFMSEDEVYKIETNNAPALYELSNSMNMYLTKLTLLNNAIYNTVLKNDQVNNTKLEVVAKAHKVKSLCDQCLSEKNNLSNKNLNSLEEINNMIMTNTSRINLTQNEIKNNLSQINDIKKQYSSNTETLSSRYQKLEGSLNTRLSYYNNIISGLDNISSIVLSNCDVCEDCGNCDDCMTLEETDETKNSVESSNKESVYEHNKIYRNIDTYENSGKDIYGFNKRDRYNKDGYLNNNYQNPYYNGYNYGTGMGINNAYNYGYNPYMTPYGNNMPFGFGNGFMIPNINTFGFYKNIDTYKPSPKPYIDKDNNDINNTTDIQNDEQPYKDMAVPNPVIPDKVPQRVEKQVQDNELQYDDGEDKFVSTTPIS